jgi:predicted PurR-regulated permease PerM
VSGWQISGIILASALAVLLLALAYLLAAKLGAVIAETQTSVRRITDELIPTLQGVTVSVDHVNDQLVRVDAITGNVEKVSSNVSGLSSVFAAALGGPAIKAAAFSYGVRKALGAKKSEAQDKRVRAQLKAEAKAARAARKKG